MFTKYNYIGICLKNMTKSKYIVKNIKFNYNFIQNLLN